MSEHKIGGVRSEQDVRSVGDPEFPVSYEVTNVRHYVWTGKQWVDTRELVALWNGDK